MPVSGIDQVDPWSLKGRTALITGATKGIGRAIAEGFAELGGHVWICARTSKDLAERLEQYASATWSGSIHGSVCDVSIAEDRKQLMDRVSAHFGSKLDILVNNAGISNTTALTDLSHASFSEVMATNLEAGLHLSQLAYPLMKANGKGGAIVLNSSILGSFVGGLKTSVYSMSKAAMNQLGRDLAFEWAKGNIRVNVIAPGCTYTSMIGDAKVDVQRFEEHIPLRRFAHASEIANVVAFMCMPSASYMTGAVVTVDGGMSIHVSPSACSPCTPAPGYLNNGC